MSYFKQFFILVVLMLLACSQGFSQGYQSIFGDSSTSWKMIRWGGERGPYVDSEYVNGTITDDGKVYKYVPPTNGIREDTVAGKVWSWYDGEETLVMDMSLNESDSFFLNYEPRSDFDTGWYKVKPKFRKFGLMG
jgi:hypothetical protein